MMKLEFALHKQNLDLHLAGDYLNFDDEQAKAFLLEKTREKSTHAVSVDAAELGRWDSTLVVVLYELAQECRASGKSITFKSFPENLKRLIELAFAVDRKPSLPRIQKLPLLDAMGDFGYAVWGSIGKGLAFISQCLFSFHQWLLSRAVMRKVDFLFALQDCSYKAIGIVSLVSFMVGLILAFVGAIQLKTFGAQIYVASLVAIGMTRIMGAIMVGIIMAGRTGASYAATIGTMQVNEEIDALKTMGIPVADFLVLPRIMALTIATPFLVILADFMGIVGGAAVGSDTGHSGAGILQVHPQRFGHDQFSGRAVSWFGLWDCDFALRLLFWNLLRAQCRQRRKSDNPSRGFGDCVDDCGNRHHYGYF